MLFSSFERGNATSSVVVASSVSEFSIETGMTVSDSRTGMTDMLDAFADFARVIGAGWSIIGVGS